MVYDNFKCSGEIVKLLEHNAGTEYRTRKNQWCVLLHSTEAKPSDARRTSCDIYLTKRAATVAVAVLRALPKTLPLPAVDSLARVEAIMNLPDMTDAQMRDISKDYQDYLADETDDDEWDPDAPETGSDVLIGRSFAGITVPYLTTDTELGTVVSKIWVLASDLPNCVVVRRLAGGEYVDAVMKRDRVLTMCGIGGDLTDALMDMTMFPSVATLLKKSPRTMDGRVSAKDTHAVARHAGITVPDHSGFTTAAEWLAAGNAAACVLYALIESKKAGFNEGAAVDPPEFSAGGCAHTGVALQ